MKSRLKSVLNNLNEERGSIFPMVLILLVLAALLVPALLGLVRTGLVSGVMYQEQSKELYAADAGVMDALWVIAHNSEEEMVDLVQSMDDGSYDKYIHPLPYPVNDKTVTYEITIANVDAGIYVIKSTATGPDDSSTTIEVRVSHHINKNPPLYAAVSLNGDLKINAILGSDGVETYTEYVGDGDGATTYFNLDYSNIVEITEVKVGDDVLAGDAYEYDDGLLHIFTAPPSGDDIFATYDCIQGWVNIYGYGLTDIFGRAEVYGDAHYWDGGEGVDVRAYLAGEEIPHSFPLTLAEDFGSPAEEYPSSRTINSGEVELKDIRIQGDLTINGGVVRLTGNVWVEGKISISGTGVVIDEEHAMNETPYYMISEYGGNDAIVVNGSPPEGFDYKVRAALYAGSPGANIKVNGDGALDGSAVAWGDVEILGSAMLRNTIPLVEGPLDAYQLDIHMWKIY